MEEYFSQKISYEVFIDILCAMVTGGLEESNDKEEDDSSEPND